MSLRNNTYKAHDNADMMDLLDGQIQRSESDRKRVKKRKDSQYETQKTYLYHAMMKNILISQATLKKLKTYKNDKNHPSYSKCIDELIDSHNEQKHDMIKLISSLVEKEYKDFGIEFKPFDETIIREINEHIPYLVGVSYLYHKICYRLLDKIDRDLKYKKDGAVKQ